MRVRLHTIGCRLNEAETERWAAQFRRRGFAIATGEEGADLVVVNTCAVTGEAVRKSRGLLRRSQRSNPDAKLIVSGCLSSLGPQSPTGMDGIDLLVTNREKDRLVEIAVDHLQLHTAPASPVEALDAETLFVRGRQRAFIKVQDGCRHRCTFCIVWQARGAERSRRAGEICDEVNRLTAAGVKEVVLTGVRLGGYGRGTDQDLTALVRCLLDTTPVERIRLGAIEPWGIPAGFWELLGEPRLMPHLHLPLQSGSERLLRRMGRRGTAAAFAKLADTARRASPDLNLTTDMIVGFPGETESDWRATLDLVAAIGFGDLHVFTYSPRPGTPAAAWPDAVPTATKRARRAQLLELAKLQRQRTLRAFVGRQMPVLLEASGPKETGGDGFGYTPNYLPVRLTRAADAPPVNCIVQVSLRGLAAGGRALVGETLSPNRGHTAEGARCG